MNQNQRPIQPTPPPLSRHYVGEPSLPWKSLLLVVLAATVIFSIFLEYQQAQAQAQSSTNPDRYVSEWTDIPAQQSVIFNHGLRTGPLELNVWVWNTLQKDQFDPLYVPYEYFGDQIQVVKVSSKEIIVANTSHRLITVKVVARK